LNEATEPSPVGDGPEMAESRLRSNDAAAKIEKRSRQSAAAPLPTGNGSVAYPRAYGNSQL